MKSCVDEKNKAIELQNVLYVPNLAYNLIFIPQARKNGYRSNLDSTDTDPKASLVELLQNSSSELNMVGKKTNGLYRAAITICKENVNVRSEKEVNCGNNGLASVHPGHLRNPWKSW